MLTVPWPRVVVLVVVASAPEQLLAGLFAPAAGLRADAAVVVHGGVPLALLTTGPTGSRARLEEGPDDVGIPTEVIDEVAGLIADLAGSPVKQSMPGP